jgi:hypothetical protein
MVLVKSVQMIQEKSMGSKLALAPGIQSAREVRRYEIGDFRATFFDKIVSFDIVEYTYVVIMYGKDSDEPLLYFTSEKNTAPFEELFRRLGIEPTTGTKESGGIGSHFFCMFDEDGHSNYGASDDWGDADKFEQEVLKAINEGLDKAPSA